MRGQFQPDFGDQRYLPEPEMPGYGPMPPQPSAAKKAIPWLKLAWRTKWFLLLFLVLGVGGGVVKVVFQEPVYRAITTMEVLGFNSNFMGMSQVDPMAGTDSASGATSIQTQMQILTSRSLLGRTVERMNLEMAPVTTKPATVFTKVRARIPFWQKEPLEQTKDAVMQAAQSVKPQGVGATRLMQITCESTSPEVAANFLNTLTAEHIAQSLAQRSSATQRTSQWMEAQLEEAKARLQQAGEKLQEFTRQGGTGFFPEQQTLADSKLRGLQGELAGIQADRIAKQSRLEAAKNATAENLPAVTGDPGLMGIRTQINSLKTQMAQLTTTLTPQHYKVQKMQAQVTELEAQLEKEKGVVLKKLQSDYEEALRREKLLAGAYGGQSAVIGSQADKANQYAMLRREVEMAQQVYNNLLQLSNQAGMLSLVPTSNVRVVDAAIANEIPLSPDPKKDIPTMAFAGLALGYGLVVLREFLRNKRLSLYFDTPGDTATLLGVPELGVIPSAEVLEEKRRWLPKLPGLRKSAPPTLTGEVEPEGELVVPVERRPELVSWREQNSMLAESFRHTLTSILRARPTDHTPVYVLTSSGPGEGKTTLSANLSIAMAQTGLRVLLVDADLRRARMQKLFGLENERGLGDLLAMPSALDSEAVRSAVQPSGVENLHVMTHGRTDADVPTLLFFTPRLLELLDEMKRQFDVVLVDTAPALAFPDARLVGKHSDGVVLVLRSGKTPRESAMAVRQRFQEDGVPVLGTILNDWTPSMDQQAYTSYHYYSAYAKKGKG